MPEFSAPLRVTWELPANPSVAVAHWEELVRSRVLFVELALAPGRQQGFAAVAERLGDPGAPRLTLAAGVPEATAVMETLPPARAAVLDLLLLPPYSEAAGPALAAAFRSVTWAVWSTAEGLEAFPQALQAARAAGGGVVAVLNPPAPAAPLTTGQRRLAADQWREAADAALVLRVHDLFLAREMGLEPFREYAGCQAGDALAHLAADGVVTACRTLPVALGTLASTGLREIWAGEARAELRCRLSEVPANCADCAVAGRCRGGCRGLVEAGGGVPDLTGRDPSCPGPLGTDEGGAR